MRSIKSIIIYISVVLLATFPFPRCGANELPFYSYLSSPHANGQRSYFFFYKDPDFVKMKLQGISPIKSTPRHPQQSLISDSILLVQQHEAGFADSHAERTVMVTDNVIDCVAGTIWNATNKTGCLFHYDRYCAPQTIQSALDSVTSNASVDDVEITLTSSFISKHFFHLKDYIINQGFTIKQYDCYEAWNEFMPNSGYLSVGKNITPLETFHIVLDPEHWKFERNSVFPVEAPQYPRKLALDVTTGRVHYDVTWNETEISWQRSTPKAQYSRYLCSSKIPFLNYFNEKSLQL